MDARTLRSQIERIDTLPTIPNILKKLFEVIENPKTSLNEIGNFILKDPVLTSRVLKMVNSPIYGFPGRISSISQALILLGLNVVKGMLLGVSVFDVMQKSMLGLWEHSVGCAVTSRILSKVKGLDDIEDISVAALLHDIGKVILSLKFPNEYQKIVRETESKEEFIIEAERRFFGITHADVGGWVAQRWNFPKNLVEAIEYHHKPNLSRNVPVHTAIVHLSDIFIKARGFGYAGDNFVPAVNSEAWKIVGLTEKDIKATLEEMEEILGEAQDFLFVDV
ncbi:MAG TPA: HDOD domain-containing protein [Dissulfurispiraceae bacterium]|nr:HDOD domain-containing protein [Dissulfurispiraceae bacterium]